MLAFKLNHLPVLGAVSRAYAPRFRVQRLIGGLVATYGKSLRVGVPATPLGVDNLRKAYSLGKEVGVSTKRLQALARIGKVAVESMEFAEPVGFVPSYVKLGRAGIVGHDRFVPVAEGVVADVYSDGRAITANIGGKRFVCLWEALGGPATENAQCMTAALRNAARGYKTFTAVGAPGSSGRVLAGYFCGIRQN
jgi:hypothetical protein